MVSFYGWNRVDRFMSARKNAGFSVVGHGLHQKLHIEGRICGLSPRMRLHRQKDVRRCLRSHCPTCRAGNIQAIVITRLKSPLPACNRSLRASHTPNAIVLDPFAGSGSTCVAALQSGRRYIGIELFEQYHRAGQQRLAAVQRAMQQGPRMITGLNRRLRK